MSNIDLNVDVGQTKTLTFNTKDKYNSEDIVFNIAAINTLADWAKAATKPSYTWSEINNKPTFATVATSGSYNDLSDKPSLNYLPLAGGTMTGNLDMGGKDITNGGFFEANLKWGGKNFSNSNSPIDASMIGELGANRTAFLDPSAVVIEYSRDNGVTWLDYGASDIDKRRLFTPYSWNGNSQTYLVVGKSGDANSDTPINANCKLRITINTMGVLYTMLNKFAIRGSIVGSVDNKTTIQVRRLLDANNNNDVWTTLVEKTPFDAGPGYSIINIPEIKTAYQANHTSSYSQIRFIFESGERNPSSSATSKGFTIYNIMCYGYGGWAVSSDMAKFGNLFRWDYNQNTTFPAKVTSQEPINYDAIIKPTQTGNTVTKTNNWVLQYLTQGVHWLRDNKVETNSDATLKSLTIKDSSNNEVLIETTPNSLIVFSDISGNIPFVIRRNTLEIVPGSAFSNQVSLGLQNQYWKEVWAGKYKIPGGTSSQFLKADGSVDSTSYQSVISDLDTIRTNATNGNTAYGWGNHANAGYATLDSNGKVPTSQLPSYVDDVVEYETRASFPATGEKGKIYVDITENDIYRWTGSTYIKISGIIGAQGEKGLQGYQGYQGKSGVDGVQGYQGYQGKSGVDGAQGTRGYQGYTGAQGATGLQGATGTRGVQGFQGIKGTDGTNGTNGVQGLQGKQGSIGPQGPSRFNDSIITVTPPTSSASYLQVRINGTVRGYKYISLVNAINPTGLTVEITAGSHNIEHVVLLKNNTNRVISFSNLNYFDFKFNGTTCPGLYPNDLSYFSLNRGEAVEMSFMYNAEFGGIIVSIGNIYTYYLFS